MADLPATDRQIDRLGKYEIRGVLGRGAMGVVYDGWDPMLERRVAIKAARLPDPDDVEAQEELGRFRREAQAAGRLSHPNVVGVYDSGEIADGPHGGTAFFVMELVEGHTLKELLAQEQRMPPGEAVRLMEDVLAGLQYSHLRGVIHRDVKPANIMVTAAGQAKIADFGIARIESSSMTQAGTMMGTPAYMSPEQFMGQDVDSRTDIYSAGVMLYQLLTGERPFEGSITAIMHKAINTTPPRPSELSVTVKPALDAVVARAMARRPEDRFPDAAAFSAALRDAWEAPDATLPEPPPPEAADDDATMIALPSRPAAPAPQARPAPAPAVQAAPRKGSKLPLIAAGLVAALAAAGGGAYVAWSGKAPAPPPAKLADVAREPPQQVLPPDPPQSDGAASEKPQAQEPPPTEPKPPQQIAGVLPPLLKPPVQADPAASRTALSNALRDVPCSLGEASVAPDGGLSVSGLAGAAQMDALRRAAGPAAEMQVRTLSPRYCKVLDMLRGMADGAPMSLALKDGAARLRDNDLISPVLTLPDSPAFMRLDYFSNDGTVTHLYPTSADVELAFAPRTGWKPKSAAGMTPWQIGPPFGTDMLVAVASSAPLLTVHRPANEPIDAYMSALQFAADALRKRGGRLTGRAVVLDTAP